MPAKKSDVWNFFKRKGNGICQCNLCGKCYRCGGGTTNLKNHLTHKHPGVAKDLNNNKSSNSSLSLDKFNTKKQRLDTCDVPDSEPVPSGLSTVDSSCSTESVRSDFDDNGEVNNNSYNYM